MDIWRLAIGGSVHGPVHLTSSAFCGATTCTIVQNDLSFNTIYAGAVASHGGLVYSMGREGQAGVLWALQGTHTFP